MLGHLACPMQNAGAYGDGTTEKDVHSDASGSSATAKGWPIRVRCPPLWSAGRESSCSVQTECQTSRSRSSWGIGETTVGKCSGRYVRSALSGVHDELRPSPAAFDQRRARSAISAGALPIESKNGTCRGARGIAREACLAKPAVRSVWQILGLQQHRRRHSKLSNDLFFVDKFRDIVGLYLDPQRRRRVVHR